MPATHAGPATEGPLLHEPVLTLLADDIGEDGAAEVVDLFLAEAPRMIGRLEQACISRGRSLLREVHTLASASRCVGLLCVGHAAADIEQAFASREPDADQMTALLDLLRASVTRLNEWAAARPPSAAVS